MAFRRSPRAFDWVEAPSTLVRTHTSKIFSMLRYQCDNAQPKDERFSSPTPKGSQMSRKGRSIEGKQTRDVPTGGWSTSEGQTILRVAFNQMGSTPCEPLFSIRTDLPSPRSGGRRCPFLRIRFLSLLLCASGHPSRKRDKQRFLSLCSPPCSRSITPSFKVHPRSITPSDGQAPTPSDRNRPHHPCPRGLLLYGLILKRAPKKGLRAP